jgi:hypothetical protein
MSHAPVDRAELSEALKQRATLADTCKRCVGAVHADRICQPFMLRCKPVQGHEPWQCRVWQPQMCGAAAVHVPGSSIADCLSTTGAECI